MPTAHRILSSILRVFEFCMSAVNLGILAKFFRLLDDTNAYEDPRWTYALAMAAISLSFSFCLIPPFKYSYYCFPLDFAMFVMWIVSFALLQDLAGVHTCSSHWYDENWVVYWEGVAVLGGSACAKVRVILALSFVIPMFWFFSGLLGLYASVQYHNLGPKTVKAVSYLGLKKKSKKQPLTLDEEANLASK